MTNEMQDVTVESVSRVAHNAVVFTISLEVNASLRDPDVVQRSMNAFMEQYPGVEGWAANASGGILSIKVQGKVRNI